MEGDQSWPTQPHPTGLPPYIKHTFGVDDINPYLPADDASALRTRLLAARNTGPLHAAHHQGYGERPREQRRHAVRRRRGRAPHRRGLRRRSRQPGHRQAAASRRRAWCRWSSRAAWTGRLPAELPDVPRRQPAGHRYRGAPRASGRRCGEQHRRRLAPVRRRCDSRRARGRQEPHAAVPPCQHRGCRQPGELSSHAGGRARTRRVRAVDVGQRPWDPVRRPN